MFIHTPHLSWSLLMSGKLIVINKKINKAYILQDEEILMWYLLKTGANMRQLKKLSGITQEKIANTINTLIDFRLIKKIEL
jgi:hypothetical protein